MQTFNEAAYKIAAGVADLIISKQHDYGHGNILAFGEFGVLVRASDKLERLKNLHRLGDCPANETIEDTWKDLAGYALIALMLGRKVFELPLEEVEK